jgi:hypothetical protein
MANVFAIHSVGQSLVTYLSNSYPAELRLTHDCGFELISGTKLKQSPPDDVRITLFLYRVTVNEHLRNAGRVNGRLVEAPLSVDLHYLLTSWAEEPLKEQLTLAWAMRQLHMHPVLDRSSLSPEAGWDAGDVVQIIPAELSNEDIMRVWDSLETAYRLSVSYIARVVRIDPDRGVEARPVVDMRLEVGGREVPQ